MRSIAEAEGGGSDGVEGAGHAKPAEEAGGAGGAGAGRRGSGSVVLVDGGAHGSDGGEQLGNPLVRRGRAGGC